MAMWKELKNGTWIKRRHFYNEVEYEIDYDNKLIRLKPEFRQRLMNENLWGKFGFKKIGGSSLGGVLSSNPWGSQFAESIRIMWLGMPMFDDKYVAAGNAVEPLVIDVINKMKGVNVETYDAAEYDYDYFQGSHEAISGLPDATIHAQEQLYEIKTTGEKNYAKWEQYGVPEYYKQQALLYHHLLYKGSMKSKPTIVALFLKPEDYKHPSLVKAEDRVMKSYKLDYDPAEVEAWIKKAESFRRNIINHGVSYHWDPSKKGDMELLSYLECKSEAEYIQWLKSNGHI